MWRASRRHLSYPVILSCHVSSPSYLRLHPTLPYTREILLPKSSSRDLPVESCRMLHPKAPTNKRARERERVRNISMNWESLQPATGSCGYSAVADWCNWYRPIGVITPDNLIWDSFETKSWEWQNSRTVMCWWAASLFSRPFRLSVNSRSMVLTTILHSEPRWSKCISFLSNFYSDIPWYLAQAISALCMEILWKWSRRPHGHQGPWWSKLCSCFLIYNITSPNRCVFAVGLSLAQAISALCMERLWKWSMRPHGQLIWNQ